MNRKVKYILVGWVEVVKKRPTNPETRFLRTTRHHPETRFCRNYRVS